MLRVNRLALCIGFLYFAGAVFAQVESATVTGKVTDSSGALISGADVEITSLEHGTTSHTTSNGSGIYLFPAVRPGRYNVEVRHEGFRQIDALGLTVNLQDHVEENFEMQVGSAVESVTVNAGGATLDTQDATVSTVIDRNFAENVPLNGRSFNTLLQLTPGVVIAPTVQGFSTGQFSIAGQRQDANNFTIDGVSANFGVGAGIGIGPNGTGNNQAFSALGGTSSLVSVEDLEEFRIATSTSTPEFGRNSGGQVMLTTRSGTNEPHGGAYDYFRNDVLDANDWFANQADNPRAKERHNDFGAFLGGPFWKDKTFFFASYEGARLRLPESMEEEVPSAFARASAPPTLAPYLNAYPQPNDRAVITGVWTAPFSGTFSNTATLNAGSVRIDHRFNDRFQLFGRFNDAPSAVTPRGNGFALSTTNPTSVDTKTFTVGLNMDLDARRVNTIRANYSTQNSSLSTAVDSFGGATPLPPVAILGSLSPAQNSGIFQTSDTGEVELGLDGVNKTKQMALIDNFDWILGTHHIKLGGDYRAIFLDRNPETYQVNLAATSVQSFVQTANLQTVNVSYTRPTQLLAQSLSSYVQDTWLINPRLTATYGARWEWDPAPSGRGTTQLASWNNTDNPSQIALAPPGAPIWKTSYANFGPRFGLAYRVTSDGKLVLRAGAGMYYDPGTGEVADSVLGLPNTASMLSTNVAVPITNLNALLPTPPTLQPPFASRVYGYSQGLELPRSYQWNTAVEKTIGDAQVISATYVGQAGRDLTRVEAYFQPNANFQNEFLLTNNSAYSNYDALQLQYRRPLAQRVEALLNYTWAHSLDNASNDTADALPSNIISAARDYSLSDFDVRHSFSGSVIFNVPGLSSNRISRGLTEGWSLDTVIVARTGFPYNGMVLTVNPDPGFFATVRPDSVPGQPFYLNGANCASVFQGLGVLTPGQVCPGGKGLNPAAFALQSTPRQGTEPRNNIPGFGLAQVDLSLARKFTLTEHVNVQFRTDAFNVLNHPNFTNPIGFVDIGPPFLLSMSMLNQGLGGLNPLFQEGGSRSLQLSLKLQF